MKVILLCDYVNWSFPKAGISGKKENIGVLCRKIGRDFHWAIPLNHTTWWKKVPDKEWPLSYELTALSFIWFIPTATDSLSLYWHFFKKNTVTEVKE